MAREIVLPPHLYDRIKASAGEHGGIGAGTTFTADGVPFCVHGHAWGSESRMRAQRPFGFAEPELEQYITPYRSDHAVAGLRMLLLRRNRIPFWLWRMVLNVRRGVEAPAALVTA